MSQQATVSRARPPEPRADQRGGRGLRFILSVLWRYRELLKELVSRDLADSYMGSTLNRAWAVIHPVLIIALYVYVFGYVFKARLGAELPQVPDYAVFMLSGLSAWLTVQSALAKGVSSLLGAANLVKQVVFPIELLPIRAVLAAHIPLLVGLVLVVAYSLLRFGIISPLLPLVVYVVVAQAMLLAGAVLLLSALTVFIRDVREFVTFFTVFGVFLMPMIYLPGSVSPTFEAILYLNPFSYAVWCLQDVFFFQAFRHPAAWLVLGPLGALAMHFGARFFEKTRGAFGDLL